MFFFLFLATDQKIQEQNEQYQLSRAKLSEGFTLALQKKDEVGSYLWISWTAVTDFI